MGSRESFCLKSNNCFMGVLFDNCGSMTGQNLCNHEDPCNQVAIIQKPNFNIGIFLIPVVTIADDNRCYVSILSSIEFFTSD